MRTKLWLALLLASILSVGAMTTWALAQGGEAGRYELPHLDCTVPCAV